jgi:hypothetical protein
MVLSLMLSCTEEELTDLAAGACNCPLEAGKTVGRAANAAVGNISHHQAESPTWSFLKLVPFQAS